MRSWVSRIGITRKGNGVTTVKQVVDLHLSCEASNLSVCPPDMQTRFPGGKKVTRYRKAMLERFSSTVTDDGLISRLTTYQDLSCETPPETVHFAPTAIVSDPVSVYVKGTKVAGVKEWYKHRSDGLEEREINQLENSTTERFKSGRVFDLLCKSTAKRSDQEELQLAACLNWFYLEKLPK